MYDQSLILVSYMSYKGLKLILYTYYRNQFQYYQIL